MKIPFFARVRFRQVKKREKDKETHRVGPTMVWGVFFGWALKPGGEWTGRYYCVALTDFIGMDLRVGKAVHVQEIYEVLFDDTEVIFPLKAKYDRAHGTLEGS